MIGSFRHKGLERLYTAEDGRKLPPALLDRIGRLLHALGEAERIEDLNIPSFKLHLLSGRLKGFWAVLVNANWRIVFRFENGVAFDVDFLDYH